MPDTPHTSSIAGKVIVIIIAGMILIGFGATGWWVVNRHDQLNATPASTSSQVAGQQTENETTSESSIPSQPLQAGDTEETWNGVRFLPADGSRLMLHELSTTPPSVVLLVHGLDDPGWTWDELIVALQKAGHDVARFDYPNDDSIVASAHLLGEALVEMKAAGVEEVSVVAHSMGGLVTRELLTNPAFYDGDGSGTDQLPEMQRLIMLGTPNHGSQFARFRGIGELREQIVRVFSGERDVFRFLSDGQGEAGEDLLPGSDFLEALNHRPLATQTKYTIVAGRVSPISEDDVHGWIDGVISSIPKDKLPKWTQRKLNGLNGNAVLPFVDDLIGGVGDGVVTIESAKLDDVDDFVLVEGNHLSMIHNVFASERVPPAIPVVLDRLEQDRNESE